MVPRDFCEDDKPEATNLQKTVDIGLSVSQDLRICTNLSAMVQVATNTRGAAMWTSVVGMHSCRRCVHSIGCEASNLAVYDTYSRKGVGAVMQQVMVMTGLSDTAQQGDGHRYCSNLRIDRDDRPG